MHNQEIFDCHFVSNIKEFSLHRVVDVIHGPSFFAEVANHTDDDADENNCTGDYSDEQSRTVTNVLGLAKALEAII